MRDPKSDGHHESTAYPKPVPLLLFISIDHLLTIIMEPTKEKQSTERDDPRRGTCPIKPEYLKPRTTFIPKPVVDQDTSLEKEKDPKTSSSFKKRPREPPVDRATTLCRAVASSGNPDACPFGAKCNRSHDVLAYLNTKEPDLGPVCPNFQKLGYCKFGFTCRYGGEHIKTKSGLEKEEAGQPTHGFVNVVLRTSGPVSGKYIPDIFQIFIFFIYIIYIHIFTTIQIFRYSLNLSWY